MSTSAHDRDDVTVVIPAKNEARNLEVLLPDLRERYPRFRILVVDDGSTDDTPEVCARNGVEILEQPYNMGNGAAIKAGARKVTTPVLVLMDADGQHPPADVERLLARLDEGFDMAVGARDWSAQANVGRGAANTVFNTLAGWMVDKVVPDLTSGFRAVRTVRFREFIYMLPNGFSYPTTITMAFFRAGYGVAYVPVAVRRREGRSHISPMRDGLRFLLIIFKVGTLYSPLKLFAPISAFFLLLGGGYYAYTYLTALRFTNMSALLLITSVLVFLIGLVSEQITTLLYSNSRAREIWRAPEES